MDTESTPPTSDTQEPPILAIHGDPSRHQTESTSKPLPKNGVAWVRPSDLPTVIGTRLIGRGLDLKAELVRRATLSTGPRAPRARVTKTAIAEPEPPSITHRPGGISL